MKQIYILLFLLPFNAAAQFWHTEAEEYFFISTGLDVRNAIFGGTVNDASYDGTWSIGYRNAGFSLIAYYENFSAIRYALLGINPGLVIRPGKQLVPVTDLSLSLISRPWHVYPSLAVNGRLEYHFDRFFVYARGEYRWRTDYDFFQASVYGGISYKFGLD